MGLVAPIAARIGASWIGTAFKLLPWTGCAVLIAWVLILRADNATLKTEAQNSQLGSVITGLEGQVQNLTVDNVVKEAQIGFVTDMGRTGNAIVGSVFTNANRVTRPLRERPTYVAPDSDAPAAPALCDAADRLQRFAKTLGEVRAGDHQGSRLPDVRYPGRALGAVWLGLTCPFSQAQFAEAVFKMADAYGNDVLKLDAIAVWEATHNNKIKNLNEGSGNDRQ